MGMFSKLFGSSGSDKADKMRQAAIDAFNSIQTPALKDLQVQLQQYVSAGKLTPEQAEAQLLSSNAFNDIVTDPSYTGAAKQALQQMQDIATKGGLTAVDKAQLNDITNQQNQEAKSRNASIMQNAQERGTGSSDLNIVNQLLNEQSAADRASNSGVQVAANAEARALQAMQAAGAQGSALEKQAYAEEANKAQAQNAIDLFNKQTLNQTNLYNTDTANRAQAANLSNDQTISNANTSTANQEKVSNAQAVQQQYNDVMQKAQGQAGVYNQWANDATAQAKNEKAADMALTGDLLKGGATAVGTAFAGPVGGAVAGQSIGGGNTTNKLYKDEGSLPGYSEGGPVEGCNYCSGGMCMEHGGKVPGIPNVPHNSPKNDTVKANLSPGEVVVPLDAQNDDKEFEAFMERFRPSKQKKSNIHVPPEAKALANLHQRISDLEAK